jgi:hypothetical protein
MADQLLPPPSLLPPPVAPVLRRRRHPFALWAHRHPIRIIAIVLGALFVAGMVTSAFRHDQPAPAHGGALTACEAIAELHDGGSQSSFESAARSMLRRLPPDRYDAAVANIAARCPQYAYLVG